MDSNTKLRKTLNGGNVTETLGWDEAKETVH